MAGLLLVLPGCNSHGQGRQPSEETGTDDDGGLPRGGPPALHAGEAPRNPPEGWPFPEAFPRTSGFGRLSAGASYWSSFLYDDHGALGALVAAPQVIFSAPVGTFVYPAGNAYANGADIAGAAIGLDGDDAWFRVDWQTLADSAVPIAMWAFDVDDDALTGAATWPAGAGVASSGVEAWLAVSSRGAWLLDADGGRADVGALGGTSIVDVATGSFLVRLPARALPFLGLWRVRLASGLATDAGDAFAPVPPERGSLPGQPSVYDVAFRTDAQEPLGRDSWWRDRELALALAGGDVSAYSLEVDWSALAARVETPEPRPTGWTNRWYFSAIEIGPGIAPNTRYYASDFLPNYMGRRQPYGVYVPASATSGAAAPLTVLLHSINVAHNQFINWNPDFIQGLCEVRGSICVAPLGRGADGWWANEAELDVWETWNRVAAEYALDPTRTVLAGYSMGGYGAYRLGLEHPDLFAAVLVLAGAPACSVRLVEGVEGSAVSGNRECDQESNTSPLLENARDVPFYLGHDALDELAPASSAVEQAMRFDALGYRHRIEVYANQDHVGWSNTGTFDGALAWLARDDRRTTDASAQITYTWYAQHQRADLGTGPGSAWWIDDLVAASDAPGFRGRIDAVSHALSARDPLIERTIEPITNRDGPAIASELSWSGFGAQAASETRLDLDLQGVAAVTLDLSRAGLPRGAAGRMDVTVDGTVELSLRGLASLAAVRVADGAAQRASDAGFAIVVLEAGRTTVTIDSE